MEGNTCGKADGYGMDEKRITRNADALGCAG
jgi:hypothetical protein